MFVLIECFWRKSVLWDKKEKHLTQLICDCGCIRKVKMSKNEKHFSRRLNIQVSELLQVQTEAATEWCFGKQVLSEF